MTRYRAALIHLAASAAIVGSVLAAVFLLWYPDYLFQLAGAYKPVLVMVGVDVTLGPLLTLIVFKAGKPGLKFDLAVIFLIQLIALGYGSLTLFNERPHFLVFAKGSFTPVAARHVDMEALNYDELADKPAMGPVKAYAALPDDPAERNAIVEAVLFRGEPDLEFRAELFKPFANAEEALRRTAVPLESFEPGNAAERAEIDAALARFSDTPTFIVPVRSFHDDYALLLDAESLEPVTAIRVNAWPNHGNQPADDAADAN